MQQNWTSILPKIKSRYRSGKNSLAQEFFVPCISECVRYRRAAGYFSSSALKSWLGALPRIANDPKIKFELLVSPQIPAADLIVLKTLTDSTERKNHLVKSIDKIIDNIIDFETEPKDTQLRLKLFAWLIANEQLELKFGFIDGNEFTSDSATDDNLIYHEKFGIIDFPDGQVSFVGSANETERGHNRNHEYIHVFRSTEPTEKNRITEMIFDFEETWHGKTYGLIVLALSDDSIKKLISVAPRERPIFDKKEEKQNESFNTLWNHQKLAVTNFLKEKHGIIEMATGTGKTRIEIGRAHV